MARVASQRFFSRKTIFLCFFRPYCHFSIFFRIEKDAHWNFAKIGQNFSPWTPIWDHFVYFWIMSVPEQPPLKLKSEHCSRQWQQHAKSRLQLKPRLFWYRHHPKMHEMVSDRSSRADNLTNLRKISMRVFFNPKKCRKMTIWSKKTQTCRCLWKKIFEKLHGPYQSWKKTIVPI